MTQNELIEGMKKDLFNEVVFQIEVMGKTMHDEKELKQIIRNKDRTFKQLLNTMQINKTYAYGLHSILTDIANKAYNENDQHALKLIDMYDCKIKA